MSSSGASSTTTRTLSGRQSDRIAALVEATLAELRTHGYDGLTVRNAARRAGVAPATAYTYFGSKDHLVAEVFWRRLDGVELPVGDRRRRARSEEHTSELQSLKRTSYAVFCVKKKTTCD